MLAGDTLLLVQWRAAKYLLNIPPLMSSSLSCLNKWLHKNIARVRTSSFGLQDLTYLFILVRSKFLESLRLVSHQRACLKTNSACCINNSVVVPLFPKPTISLSRGGEYCALPQSQLVHSLKCLCKFTNGLNATANLQHSCTSILIILHHSFALSTRYLSF